MERHIAQMTAAPGIPADDTASHNCKVLRPTSLAHAQTYAWLHCRPQATDPVSDDVLVILMNLYL